MSVQDNQGPLNAAAIAVSSLATRKARPHVSAMSIQLFDTSIPIKRGLATRRSPDAGVARRRQSKHGLNGLKNALPWQGLSQEGQGPLARDCKLGLRRPSYRPWSRP